MTVDVRVRRCTLTVRRREGWSWGPGPQPHLDAALAGIEAAIEAAVEHAGVARAGSDGDLRLEQPVRLEIGRDGIVTAASWNALVKQLREAPAAAADDGAPVREDRETALAAADLGDVVAAAARDTELTAAALARTLARWSRTGHAARVFGAWPSQLVDGWIAVIASAAPPPAASAGAGVPATMTAEAVDRIAANVLTPGAPDAPPRERAVRLLVLLAAIVAALGERIPNAATQALARSRVRAPEPAPVAPPGGAPPSAAIAPSRPRDPGAARLAQPRELVVCALPLLVLAQLSRIGYVDAIVSAAAAAAAAAGDGDGDGAGALGAALAGKVLPAPGRGWSREPPHAGAVRFAAGIPAERLGQALADVAARERELAQPLRSALLAAYAEGRSSREELLVSAGADGIVCGEQDGLLPAAWVSGEDELDAALEALGRPSVRRDAAFAPLARALSARPGLPRLDAPALERELGAAAGTALGLIALSLWGAAGGATPLLALERLGDLEARVHSGPEGVVAAIPRGQRWLDLRRGGLLDVFTIPWLPGGRLEVVTW